MTQNAIYNKELNAYNVPKDVYKAIKSAAEKTGVNFTYLMEKAAVESSFDKNAKAKTSSATGLYQFIESTWLKMVNDHGDKYGLEKYADKISDSGKVSDSKARREILNLRKDPEIASLMAAEFDAQNYARLKENVGGDIGATELYMAHFLGAGGASGFLNAMKKSPNMAAADIFPREARANRGVFYDQKSGQPRSLNQIYAMFESKFSGGNDAGMKNFGAQQTMMAQTNTAPTAPSAQKAPVYMDNDPLARLASLMDTGRRADSLLRVSGSGEEQKNWEVFPPSLYSRLSLSQAQMMMLTDFSA